MSDDVLDLLERAPAPAMSIDPYAAVLGGRRRLRRRRAGFVAGGAAAVALVAAVGLSLLGGVPVASTPAGSGDTPQTATSARLDLGDATYTVRLVENGSSHDTLEYGGIADVPAYAKRVPHIGGTTMWVRADRPDTIVGVVPSGGPGLTAWLGPGPGGSWDMRREPIVGTAYDAFAIKVLGGGDATDIAAIDWQDVRGAWHSTRESDETTAVFTSRGGEIVRLWVTPDRSSWGVAWAGMQGEFAGRPSATPTLVRYGDNGVGAGGSGTTPAWGAFGLLPPGATKVDVRAREGSEVTRVTVGGQRLGGFTPWFAELGGPGTAAPGSGVVESIAWTDADGVRHEMTID